MSHARGRAQGPLHTSELVVARATKRKYTPRLFKPLSIGTNMHPVLKWIFTTMNEKSITITALEKSSGVPRGTIFHWRAPGCNPSLWNIAAVVEALGARIVIEVLPQPDDLARADPPGHALPAKEAPPPNGLTPITPQAIVRDGATRAGGGTQS